MVVLCVLLWREPFASSAPLLLLPVTAFGLWLLDGRLEIREQGIVNSGRLLRWGNIESYHWNLEQQPRNPWLGLAYFPSQFPVLEVRMRRLLKARPPVRMPVLPTRREAVDALLSRYLSDWPAPQAPEGMVIP
jgi:hypothetical protein